jgi:hypothetical protein
LKLHASIDPVLPPELEPGSELVPDVVGAPEVSPALVDPPPVDPVTFESPPLELVELVELPPVELVELAPPPLDASLPGPGLLVPPQAVTLHQTPMNTTGIPPRIPSSLSEISARQGASGSV